MKIIFCFSHTSEAAREYKKLLLYQCFLLPTMQLLAFKVVLSLVGQNKSKEPNQTVCTLTNELSIFIYFILRLYLKRSLFWFELWWMLNACLPVLAIMKHAWSSYGIAGSINSWNIGITDILLDFQIEGFLQKKDLQLMSWGCIWYSWYQWNTNQ